MKPWHVGCLPALSRQLWLQGERMLFLFICLFSRQFPASSHFFVWAKCWKLVMLTESLKWKEFISTEKGFYVSRFNISEYFSVTLLFLVFLCRLVVVTHLPTHQVDPSFKLRKHFRKAVSFGIYETHNSIFCSAWVLVWQVVHALYPQGYKFYVNSYLILL